MYWEIRCRKGQSTMRERGGRDCGWTQPWSSAEVEFSQLRPVICERWSLAFGSFPPIKSISAFPAMPGKPACQSTKKVFETMPDRPTAVCRPTRRAAYRSCLRVWLNTVVGGMQGRHNLLVVLFNQITYTDRLVFITRDNTKSENFWQMFRGLCLRSACETLPENTVSI